MVSRGCPFGGTPGTWLSLGSSLSPTEGYRVISGPVWWTLIYWPWRMFLAAQSAGIPASPPRLGPPGSTGVYFTDRDSLEGLLGPGDFAKRLGLPPMAHRDCNLYGSCLCRRRS